MVCSQRVFYSKNRSTSYIIIIQNYLFSEIGVNRVCISHAIENPGSGRVAQKCGMTYEGTKREYFKTSTGKFVDIVDYAILKSEWEINKYQMFIKHKKHRLFLQNAPLCKFDAPLAQPNAPLKK